MWTHLDTVHYRCATNLKSSIAGFDLDYTLIKPKSNKKFPIDKNDWELLFNNVKQVLHQLTDHSIVIFTNQLKYNDDICKKIDDIITELDLDITVIISSKNNHYRKPMIGMWDLLLDLSNVIDLSTSFYCGDAVGRDTDFSDTDYKFAHNIGLQFRTPEELFIGKLNKTIVPYIDLRKYVVDKLPDLPKSNNDTKPELIILVGYPASGKSYLATQFKYHIINQDTLKTRTKCLVTLKKYLANNENVVIDCLNYKPSMRGDYIQLAKQKGYYVRCVNITNDLDFCWHMNQVRTQITNSKYKLIPKVVYYTMRKHFHDPVLDEGFDQIDTYENKIILNDNKLERYYHFMYSKI